MEWFTFLGAAFDMRKFKVHVVSKILRLCTLPYMYTWQKLQANVKYPFNNPPPPQKKKNNNNNNNKTWAEGFKWIANLSYFY